jgi:ABC-type amino acid transport substrate-binding protein
MCRFRQSLLSALFLVSLPAIAVTTETPPVLRVCYLNVGFLPFTTPEQDGPWQVTAVKAAAKVPLKVEFVGYPRERCFLSLKAGQVDAIYSAHTVERSAFLNFPLKDKKEDSNRSIGRPVSWVYRKKGSSVGWNGHHFSNLGARAIGGQRGIFTTGILEGMHVPLELSESAEQLLSKLNLDRLAAAVIYEGQANMIMETQSNLAIERLPIPFTTANIYVAVSKSFYKEHKLETEKFWNAIAEIREAEKSK